MEKKKTTTKKKRSFIYFYYSFNFRNTSIYKKEFVLNSNVMTDIVFQSVILSV